MEEYETLKNSIYKNIQEFTEFVVDNFKVTNYYDLVDLMIDLHNFRAKMFKKDRNLAMMILEELEDEENE